MEPEVFLFAIEAWSLDDGLHMHDNSRLPLGRCWKTHSLVLENARVEELPFDTKTVGYDENGNEIREPLHCYRCIDAGEVWAAHQDFDVVERAP